jgi:hypothetical protein
LGLDHPLEPDQPNINLLSGGLVGVLDDGDVLAGVLDLVGGLGLDDVSDLIEDRPERGVLDDEEVFGASRRRWSS